MPGKRRVCCGCAHSSWVSQRDFTSFQVANSLLFWHDDRHHAGLCRALSSACKHRSAELQNTQSHAKCSRPKYAQDAPRTCWLANPEICAATLPQLLRRISERLEIACPPPRCMCSACNPWTRHKLHLAPEQQAQQSGVPLERAT